MHQLWSVWKNLTAPMTYETDQICYLRCSHCGSEFSERKNIALWNCKITEDKSISIAEHLAEGVSLKGTAHLTRMHLATVRCIALYSGWYGEILYDAREGEILWRVELSDSSQSKSLNCSSYFFKTPKYKVS